MVDRAPAELLTLAGDDDFCCVALACRDCCVEMVVAATARSADLPHPQLDPHRLQRTRN